MCLLNPIFIILLFYFIAHGLKPSVDEDMDIDQAVADAHLKLVLLIFDYGGFIQTRFVLAHDSDQCVSFC